MNTESHTTPDPYAAVATDATAAAAATVASDATAASGAAPTIAKQIRTVGRLLRSEFHGSFAGVALDPRAARRLRHQPAEADTAADRAVRQYLADSRANVEARIAEALTPEELAALGETLTKVAEALGGRERLEAERSQRREAYRAGFRTGFGEARRGVRGRGRGHDHRDRADFGDRGGRGHRFGEGGPAWREHGWNDGDRREREHHAPWGRRGGAERDYRAESE